jgi:hypothetical protein
MEKSVLEKIVDPPVQNRYNLTSTSAQYPPPAHGGRIPNILDAGMASFSARSGKPYVDGPDIFGDTNRRDLIGHYHLETPLNVIFFSQANVDRIQDGIREQVYLMSGNKFIIDRQSDDDVKIIMRSYYLSFAENNPATIASDLESLNKRVIGYASAKVYSEVDFHMFYLKDLQEFATPIANPTNVHVFGSRTGELKSFF